MSQKQSMTPKRRVERVHNTINTGVTNTASDQVLHTAEDKKTLVRIRGRLRFRPLVNANSTEVAAMLRINPASAVVITPVTTQALDQDVPQQYIAGFLSSTSRDDNGAGAVNYVGDDVWEFDIKAMRKMNAGDEVALSCVSDVATDTDAYGVIDLWFKE